MIPYPQYNPERETLEVWSVRDPYPAGSLEARQFEDMLAVASPVTGDLICAWIRFDQWTLPDGSSLPDVASAFAYLDRQCRARAAVDVSSVAVVATQSMPAGTPVTVSRGNGQLLPARADSKALSFVSGVLGTDVAAGFTATAIRGAISLSDWSAATGSPALAVGQPYFLAPQGGITPSPDLTPGFCVARIGVALSTTALAVRPFDPIQL